MTVPTPVNPVPASVETVDEPVTTPPVDVTPPGGLIDRFETVIIAPVEAPVNEETTEEPAPEKPKTQEEINAAIDARFAKIMAKNDAEKGALTAKISELETVNSDLANKFNELTVKAAAERAMFTAGVKQERLADVLKLADIPTGDTVDESAVVEAVNSVLTRFPEWSAPVGTGEPVGAGDRRGTTAPPSMPTSLAEAVNQSLGLI